MQRSLSLSLLVLALATTALAPARAVDLSVRAPGRDDAFQDELRAVTLLQGLKDEDENDGQQVLAAARADYARLLGALYDRGYYAPVIKITLDGREAAEIPPLDPPARVRKARIVVETGPRFLFGTARIAPLAPGTAPFADFVPGEKARASAMRAAGEQAISDWRDQGHARAAIAGQTITARHTAERLDADLRVDPGPKLRFGPLRVTGETNVRTERIRAIAGIPEGKVFSPLVMDEAAERLQRTGTFRSVVLRESADTVGGDQMPIDAQITDMPPRRLGFGAEISSRQGLTLSTFWLHRNLLGGAERLRLEAEIGGIGGSDGGIDGRLSARFDRPATFGARNDFYALAEIEREDSPNFLSDSLTLEAGIIRRADRRRTFSAGLGFEAVHTEDAFGSRDYVLLTLPLSAEYDGRDNRLNPQGGWYGRAELTPFAGITGVDSGLRAHLDLRGYRALGDNVVLAGRAQLGSLIGPDLADSPTDMLFYSGGSATVRGYDFQSLGITLPGGDVTGGRSFAGVSAELRVKTGERLSVVSFVDYGVVGEDALPGGGSDDHSGAGLGLRYDTGIGPIRLDVATPLTGDGDGVQIYIGIGQAF